MQPSKNVETEVKLRAPGLEEARSALARIGAELRVARHLEDNLVFDDAGGSLAASGRLLRLRRTPHGCVLTYKGPPLVEGGLRTRPELEVAVGDAARLQGILGGLGLEIVVDETPFAVFFELEGDAAAIHEAASALGYGPADYITDSYAALFFAAGGSGDMVFGRSEAPEESAG